MKFKFQKDFKKRKHNNSISYMPLNIEKINFQKKYVNSNLK